jgi:hypothetical protein
MGRFLREPIAGVVLPHSGYLSSDILPFVRPQFSAHVFKSGQNDVSDGMPAG